MDKYGWIDVGSSFLPSEIISAFLWAQLECLQQIQMVRKSHWHDYEIKLTEWAHNNGIQLPEIPNYATNNGHMFYLVCKNLEQRTVLIDYLKQNEISASFHYISLHKSPFYLSKHEGSDLTEADRFTDTLVRLPLFYELNTAMVVVALLNFFIQTNPIFELL